MPHILEELENKINKLEDKKEATLLLKSYQNSEFNVLFRQTSIKMSTLGIAEFLYVHQDELNLNVNAKGKSQKTALDFAIERGSELNVLFLLKMKEIEVDDYTRDKIKRRFGTDFRKDHIASPYVSLGNQLMILAAENKK